MAARPPEVDADFAKLLRMRDVAIPGSPLAMTLYEVIEASKKVGKWGPNPQGWCIAYYDQSTHKISSYEILYRYGNVGNLVHELTHAAVNEAFKQDFVNYPNSSGAARVPAPVYSEKGWRKNEQDRQGKWMDNAQNDKEKAELQRLQALAVGAGLPPDQATEINTKFNYGIGNMYIEHDTVINQILTWMAEWYPRSAPKALNPLTRQAHFHPAALAKVSTPSWHGFHRALETAVLAAYNRRHR